MKYLLVIFIIYLSCSDAKSQSRVWEVSDSLVILDSKYNFNTIQNVSISCIDKNNCIAFSNKGDAGAILRKTSDGGKNWAIIYVDTTILRYNDEGKLDSTTYWATEYNNFKYFANNTLSFIIRKNESLTDYYQIRSNDYGKNWDTVEVFENCYPWYYYFADGSILLRITYPDKLKKVFLYSSRFEEKFDKINLPEKFELISTKKILKDYDNLIFFLNDENNESYLLRLFDNNSKYEEVKLKDIKFVDLAFSNDILYGLYSYKIDNIQKDIIYKSYDYGKTWQTILDTNAKNLRKIEFVSKDDGIAYGYTNYNVLRTNDGGINWFNDYFGGRDSSKPAKTIEISDLAIIDKDNMFLMVSKEPIYKLTDRIVGSYIDKYENLNVSIFFFNDNISIINNCDDAFQYEFIVYDILGNEVYYQSTYLNPYSNLNIDLNNLNNGVYFIKIFAKNQILYNKFIKTE